MKETTKFSLFYIGVLILCFSNTAYSQVYFSNIKNDNFYENVKKSYMFCKGQEYSIIRIKTEFPAFKSDVIKSELAFGDVFGKSCKNSEDILKNLLANQWEGFKNQAEKLFAEQSKKIRITNELVANFIEQINNRAKGTLPSPTLETLLTINPDFYATPQLEFLKEFKKTFRTQNHIKAKGLDIQISVPQSWEFKEANRPNIVQLFTNQNGFGEVSLAFQINESPTSNNRDFTSSEITALFSPQGQRNFLSKSAKILETKQVTLDSRKGVMIVYEDVTQRLDFSLKIKSLTYITTYKNKIISLQFMISDAPDKSKSINDAFAKMEILFRLIANSFIIQDQYK